MGIAVSQMVNVFIHHKMVVLLHRVVSIMGNVILMENPVFSLQGCIESKLDCLVHGKCGFNGSACVATSLGCEKSDDCKKIRSLWI